MTVIAVIIPALELNKRGGGWADTLFFWMVLGSRMAAVFRFSEDGRGLLLVAYGINQVLHRV